ncbi:MAG: heme o synthase [Bacteriovoracaceae bacterium]
MNVIYLLLYFGTFLLLLIGAQLQVLKTALVCPDWPLCFGEFLPLYMSPSFYESLHRFVAGMMVMASLGWGILRFREMKFKALLPIFLIILQSLLGWATFVYKLPTITTILHLIFSLLFLASLEGSAPLNFDEKLKEVWNSKLKDLVGLFLFLLTFQFILGGILRKSSLLASCESTMEFWECWQRQAEIPLAGSLSLMHRILGLIISLSGLFVFSYLVKALPKWKWSAVIGIVAIVAQLFLGLQMGRSSSREMVFWHFFFALIAFCTLLFLIVRLRRYEKHFFGKPIPTYFNDVLDLFKPKLTILVVITLLVGVFLSPLQMNIILLTVSMIAIWFQAAGALSLNCYYERDIDKLMERTKDRPLPAGRLRPQVALFWGWGLVIVGTVILFLSANSLTAILGFVTVLAYIYLYTPMKQYSPYALYVGAIPGAIPTVMGWTTVTGSIWGMGAYLFGILFLWQIPHFMAISYYRKKEYSNAHIMTFAQTHSLKFLKVNISLYSLLLLAFGLLPYFWGQRGESYLISSLAIGVILVLFALSGWVLPKKYSYESWARSYFWATLFYLPLQMGVLLILR